MFIALERTSPGRRNVFFTNSFATMTGTVRTAQTKNRAPTTIQQVRMWVALEIIFGNAKTEKNVSMPPWHAMEMKIVMTEVMSWCRIVVSGMCWLASQTSPWHNSHILIHTNNKYGYLNFLQGISEFPTTILSVLEWLMQLTAKIMTMMVMTTGEVEQSKSEQHWLLQWHFSQFYLFKDFPMMQVLKKQQVWF